MDRQTDPSGMKLGKDHINTEYFRQVDFFVSKRKKTSRPEKRLRVSLRAICMLDSREVLKKEIQITSTGLQNRELDR